MFELYVVVAGSVMFNILELIMKIVPNYPTKWLTMQGCASRMEIKIIFSPKK
jgi:hypothetical protein